MPPQVGRCRAPGGGWSILNTLRQLRAEQNRSGTYTQIVYAPTGQKLALMSAATLQKAFIPLPGNAQAVYASSGLSYYRHPDWLGSSRFASTPTPPTGMYSDTAYAPFGEPYAQAGATDLSFTGQNQDTVAGGLTGPYDFPAREYGTQGRWVSPDPAGLAAVDPTNPQSWNRYAYVGNQPLLYIDPSGEDEVIKYYSPIYQDCIWNGGCSGLMQGAPYGGFNIANIGGLASGIYVDGVQQTFFNTWGLGTNAVAAGYQATITNPDGSTTTVTLAPDQLGQLTASEINDFINSVSGNPGSSPTFTNVSFGWVGGSCGGAVTCWGQYPTKAWFPKTKRSYPAPGSGVANPKPPQKLPSVPSSIQSLLPGTGSSSLSFGFPLWSGPPYIW
jgi:RHS repeat-associated protein